MSNQIVILGQDYSAIFCMVNSLKNYEILVVKRIKKENKIKELVKKIILGKDIETIPENVRKIKYVDTKVKDKDIINLILEEYKEYHSGKIILIPTSDYMASVIDSNKELFDERFSFPTINGKNDEMIQLMNKATQKETAEKCGLNIIPEYNVTKKNNSFLIPNEIDYPVFIKPKVSYLGEKSIMRKCNNKLELKEALIEIDMKYNCPILIEKFVEIEKEYAILGCSYNKEIIVPGIIEKTAVAKGKSNGVTLKGKTMSLNNFENLEEKVTDFISELNFSGLFDIELYESNGKIYFNELNLRFGAEGYGITGSGVNLPEIYVEKICNKKITKINKLKEKAFLSDKANLDSFESGFISWKEYLHNSKDIDFSFIKSTSKKIEFSFKRLELYAKIKKILKK